MLKKLIEKRNGKLAEMKALNEKALGETRAFSEEESTQMEALEAEIRALDATIAKIQSDEFAQMDEPEAVEQRAQGADNVEAREIRAFANYIRGTANELRADTNMTTTAGAAVIPTTIAAQIVKKIYEISPIMARATRYNVKGTLEIPVYDDETSAVTMAYATEFSDLESTAGSFDSVELKGFLAGALSKISRSLLNSTDIDLVSFVVNDIAEVASRWIENQLLNGTTDKIAGLSGVTNVVTTAYKDDIALDELIDLQDAVADAYQGGAIWIMNTKTRNMIRKLEDKMGRKYLLDDVTAPFGKVLLGKPVYVSDNMAAPASGKKVIYYGDMKGLAVKFAEEPSIEILREKFALQHAIGAVCWVELDSKVTHKQAIACLKMGTAAKPAETTGGGTQQGQ